MKYDEAIARLLDPHAQLERQMIGSSRIVPKGGEIVTIDGQDYSWTEAAAKLIRQNYGITVRLEKKLPDEVVQTLWKARVQYESSQSGDKRCLPPLLNAYLSAGQVVGFANAELVTLSNRQVIEAIEAGTSQLSMKEATATLSGDTLAAAWELNVVFPFVRVQPRKGDFVLGGLTIKHSPAGLNGTQVLNYLYRLTCRNGSTVPICTGSKRLRIRRLREQQFADQEVIDRLGQVIAQGADEIDKMLTAVANLDSQKVDPIETLNQIALKHRVSNSVRNRLLEALSRDEAGPVARDRASMYDVWNAVTRVATHDRDLLTDSVQERLSVFSGAYSQQSIHTCPTCRRILEPSKN